MKSFRFNSLFILICLSYQFSCIEHFQFEGKNEYPALIVEGYVSDVSSNDFKKMYHKSRNFYVKLKYSGTVTNTLDEKITGAEVELMSNSGESWDYTEDYSEPGTYYLYYPDFKASPNTAYKVNIKLENGDEFESEYDEVPYDNVRAEIGQKEVTEFQYEVVSSETAIKPIPGLNVNAQLPTLIDSDFRYFRWDFDVTWKLVAEFSYPSSPTGVCWIGDMYYLDDYVLAKNMGEFPSVDLFFLQTSGNREIKFGFAAIIRQQEISRNHYQFWEDLRNQEKQADLFAPPPYNIYTNLKSKNSENPVFGFFGAIDEEYYTWYFDKKSLSYAPIDLEECFVLPNHEPAPWCSDCMKYATGRTGGRLTKGETITTEKPSWWTF